MLEWSRKTPLPLLSRAQESLRKEAVILGVTEKWKIDTWPRSGNRELFGQGVWEKSLR